MSNNVLLEKLPQLWPEITMVIGACLCMLIGLSRRQAVRDKAALIAALTLITAGLFVWYGPTSSGAGPAGFDSNFIKLAALVIGFLLLMVAASLPGQLPMTRDAEQTASGDRGGTFEPGNVMRGEFFAFFLFSLTGVMLCAGANDLVWLFLALELTSLPTYVLVAISRDHVDAHEAAVKYFFLGALATAVFLYGFALIYGMTGTTILYSADLSTASIAGYISNQIAAQNTLPPLLTIGLLLSLVGIAFKIAAVPMHFYAADVYQGAATPVTAFLAFVPKTAGFISIITLLGLVGWPLPTEVFWLLWIMAALTMTVGNVLGLLQTNVKRVLAYSSIAHTGYILVGVLVGPGAPDEQSIGKGLAAVLFYLVAYGLATVGSFAVLGCLRRDGDEAQEYDDIAGLSSREPILAAVMLISVLSLIGLPPMVGLLGKIYQFGSAISHSSSHPEFIWLVIIGVLNSAISAAYYLRIIAACYFGKREDGRLVEIDHQPLRTMGAVIAAFFALVLGMTGGWLIEAARDAALPPPRGQVTHARPVETHTKSVDAQ